MLTILRRIYHYLNPLQHIGETKYSYAFPLIVTSLTALILQLIFVFIVRDIKAVGLYAIIIFLGLIVYFAFREGKKGGFITVALTTLYYIYLTYALHYSGDHLISAIDTLVTLAILYLILAGVIGWLKEVIDKLVEQEVDEKRRLQAIIEQLPVGVLVTDDKGRVVQGNKRLDLILGIKIPLGFLLGRDTLQNDPTNEYQLTPATSPLLRSLANGKTVLRREYEYIRNDKKKLFLEISSSPIRNRAGKLIAAASIISDVTAQKELELRKDDFVNMASHELKTPITSLKLYVGSLTGHDHEFDDRTMRILRGMKNQTDKLQELVEDLLDVSRIQTGKLQFRKERFRLDMLVKEIVGELSTLSKQEMKIMKAAAVTIYADKFRIYQVMTNLLTNAMKYSPSDRKIIVAVTKNGADAVVSIQDFGIGIPKDQRRKIFERLHQAGDTLPGQTFPGLGMGLYISREIVRRHSGKIWVESILGEGSTFFVSLPYMKT